MLSEEFVSTVCGPPLASNTTIARDVGIRTHALSPAYSVRSAFKKSSTAANCLAVSGSHAFAAQHERAAYVHVYSRLRGGQEAFVPFPERIRCLALAPGDVLVLGTVEGRLMLWEYCTGRLVSTPPCHVQAVSCVATTPYHVLTGSDDSNVHVWSLARLLDLAASGSGGSSNDPSLISTSSSSTGAVGAGGRGLEHELEPERTLSNHRAGITALAVSNTTPAGGGGGPSGHGSSGSSTICVSASKDKTCVVWNYSTGLPLRTLLFPATPLCAVLDPCNRALCVSTSDEDGCVYLVELFGDRPLLGPHCPEAPDTVVQVSQPFGMAPLSSSSSSSSSAGGGGTTGTTTATVGGRGSPATCLAVSHDGTVLLSGHPNGRILRWDLADNSLPVELANLNAAVTNIAFVSPFEGSSSSSSLKTPTILKPNSGSLGTRGYSLTAQFDADLKGGGASSSSSNNRFDRLLTTPGFSAETLGQAILSFQQPVAAAGAAAATENEELLQQQNQNHQLLEIINEQRKLNKQMLKRWTEAESALSSATSS